MVKISWYDLMGIILFLLFVYMMLTRLWEAEPSPTDIILALVIASFILQTIILLILYYLHQKSREFKREVMYSFHQIEKEIAVIETEVKNVHK